VSQAGLDPVFDLAASRDEMRLGHPRMDGSRMIERWGGKR
jgi:hypothetical protein